MHKIHHFHDNHKRTESESFLDYFNSKSKNSDAPLVSDTGLVYFVLKSHIYLEDCQILTILGLNINIERHLLIFDAIKIVIGNIIEKIMSLNINNLLELPLSNIKELCYEVGLIFKAIFFVPIKRDILLKDKRCFRPEFILASDIITNNNATSVTSGGRIIGNSEASGPNQSGHASINYTSVFNNSTQSSSDGLARNESIEVIEYVSKFNCMWILVLILKQQFEERKEFKRQFYHG